MNTEVTNTDSEYPCTSCNVGFGSISSEGYTSCTDTCERYAKYLQRQIEGVCKMENKKTCAPNYEAMYKEECAKNKELIARIDTLEEDKRILLAKLKQCQGAIAMAEIIFNGKWRPNCVEVAKGV